MPNSVAEAYLLIQRESNFPVIGEAVPFPFAGQIELDAWKWDLENKKRVKEQKAEAKRIARELRRVRGPTKRSGRSGQSGSGTSDRASPFKNDELIRAVTALQVRKSLSQQERDKRVRDLIKQAVASQDNAANESEDSDEDEDEDKDDDDSDGKKLTFSFDKNVDLASTQLLEATANGEVFPNVILTLFHRSTNAPVTLAVKFGSVRLTSYSLVCTPSEAMVDMTEQWEAIFETVGYVYQNRPAASGPNFLTQGTARVFDMDLDLPF